MARKRVIIIGGGFAGLNAAKALGSASHHEITLLDRSNHHLFQPLLYQVATAALSPADIARPIREILRPHENITVLMEEVVTIDKSARELQLGNGTKMGFDTLIVATGARHHYFGHPEWEEHAPGLKTLGDALKIRERLLITYERAESSDSISEATAMLNFVVIGGGPTGVEVAGAIAEIAHQTILRDFRRVNVGKTRVYLIENGPRVLQSFPEPLSEVARRDLESLGVIILTGKSATKVDDSGVWLGEQFLPSANVIWAAGNQASPLLKSLGVPLDRAGRVIVGPDLSLPDYPDIFVVGDSAHVPDAKGSPLPGLAPVAVQQGRYVGAVIRDEIPKDRRPPFVYNDRGSLATIGKTRAVGLVFGRPVTGFWAWFLWCFIHIFYLVGFRNRVIVFTQWIFAFFFSTRGVRLITRAENREAKSPHAE